MTLQEILAKAKEDSTYDPESDLTTLIATTVADASTSLNTKNTELLQKLKEAKTAAGQLPDGFTAEEWDRLIKLDKDIDLASLKGDEKLEALRKQMTEAHASELTSFKDRESKLTSALESQLIDNAATNAINAANGNAALLLPHVKSHIKMVQGDDGEFSAVVIDPKGTERFSMINAGKTMQIDELVGELKVNDIYKSAFSSDNSGGGAGGGAGATKTANPFKKDSPDYSVTEQARLSNENPTLAKTLQEAAESPVQ